MPCKCGDGEFTNRKSSVELKDTSMCAIWQTCDASEPLSINDQVKSNIAVSLNSNGVFINSNDNLKFNQIEIFDVLERDIYTNNNGINARNKIDVSLQYNTVYFIKLKTNENRFSYKGIVRN